MEEQAGEENLLDHYRIKLRQDRETGIPPVHPAPGRQGYHGHRDDREHPRAVQKAGQYCAGVPEVKCPVGKCTTGRHRGVPGEARGVAYRSGGRDRGVLKERAGQESVLDVVYPDGRAGPGPGRRHGDGTAGGWDDYKDREVNEYHPCRFYLFLEGKTYNKIKNFSAAIIS